jgi:hypothetical protein
VMGPNGLVIDYIRGPVPATSVARHIRDVEPKPAVGKEGS